MERLYATTRATAQAIFKDSRGLHRALPRGAASHRGAARLRRPRERRLLLRARLLGPAPPPEADRGGAVDPPLGGAAQGHRRAGRGRRPVGRLHGGGDDGVPARPRRQPRLHGDERPHPGRAPGVGDGHEHRPDPGADQGGARARSCRSPRTTSCCHGHAMECRINAEDPTRDFAPAAGRLDVYVAPGGPWTRVDSHCYPGWTIAPFYDSLIAKLIVWAPDRGAGDRADAAGARGVPDRGQGRQDDDPLPPGACSPTSGSSLVRWTRASSSTSPSTRRRHWPQPHRRSHGPGQPRRRHPRWRACWADSGAPAETSAPRHLHLRGRRNETGRHRRPRSRSASPRSRSAPTTSRASAA